MTGLTRRNLAAAAAASGLVAASGAARAQAARRLRSMGHRVPAVTPGARQSRSAGSLARPEPMRT